METNRRKEVINTCLSTFVSKGLADTSSRDLSKALELQSGGLYYYFESKDDAVLACAEEAAVRLEDRLITPVFKDLDDPDRMMKRLKERADEMAPTMKFLAQVCTTSRYRQKMEPALVGCAEGTNIMRKSSQIDLTAMLRKYCRMFCLHHRSFKLYDFR